MSSSKRVTGNFNIWTGASENWTYAVSNTNITVRRGNMDTVFQSSNLVVYGNIVGLGGDIYANKIYADIVGNIVLEGNTTNFGILYKNPSGNASVSDYFIIDDANQAAIMSGNINVTGSGAGNLIANNISSNSVVSSTGIFTQANVTGNLSVGGNIAVAYISAVDYLDLSGDSIVYGNTNVFVYLSANADAKEIKLGTTATGNINGNGFINILGVVNTAANVNGLYFNGNGRFLTGILEAYGNANVANYLPLYTGGLPNLTGNVITTANISANYVLGNITQATGYYVYGNANVANYLPLYSGDLNPNNLMVSGLAEFSNVGNVRIPGGNVGQALFADGFGNLIFANVTATPGNLPGSFQYNSNGNALYGLDDFVYDTSNVLTPNVRLSNLSLNIYKGDGSISEDQLLVSGNVKILTATVGNTEQSNTGVLYMGGVNKFYFEDLYSSNYAGNIVTVSANGQQLEYSNQISLVGGTITVVGNVTASNVISTGTVIGNEFYTTGNITSGSQYITGNVDVTGNINVTGNLNYANVTDLLVGDPLIYIGANNTGNVYDLGIIASWDDGTYQHGGLVRDASDGTWKLFGNVVAEPTTVVDFANAIYQPFLAGTTNIIGNVTAGNVISNSLVSGETATITGNITGNNISGIIRPTAGSASAGIIFPNDPGGGTGDAAYIKYYASSGENTVLELNVNNDSDDNIYLNASGGTDVQNDLRATGNIIAFFSDERLKTRLGNIENALDKIDQLSTFYFEPNDIAVNVYGYSRHRDIGVSAQEVANVVPEIIAEAPIGNGYLTVKYERFAPLIIAAIKELRAEITEIKKKFDQ